jgi:hypothetical protein
MVSRRNPGGVPNNERESIDAQGNLGCPVQHGELVGTYMRVFGKGERHG